nr:MAG TPA: hypothetical protein [Caudoviricetes sp.]
MNETFSWKKKKGLCRTSFLSVEMNNELKKTEI